MDRVVAVMFWCGGSWAEGRDKEEGFEVVCGVAGGGGVLNGHAKRNVEGGRVIPWGTRLNGICGEKVECACCMYDMECNWIFFLPLSSYICRPIGP